MHFLDGKRQKNPFILAFTNKIYYHLKFLLVATTNHIDVHVVTYFSQTYAPLTRNSIIFLRKYNCGLLKKETKLNNSEFIFEKKLQQANIMIKNKINKKWPLVRFEHCIRCKTRLIYLQCRINNVARDIDIRRDSVCRNNSGKNRRFKMKENIKMRGKDLVFRRKKIWSMDNWKEEKNKVKKIWTDWDRQTAS